MDAPSYGAPVRRPTGWLGLAFFGVALYVISAVLQIYRSTVATALAVDAAELTELLGLTSWLGQVGFFAGLVAALWRANLAAGLTRPSVAGLTLGAAGVGMMGLFELALLIDFLGVAIPPVTSLILAQELITAVGTFLGFAGLASLAVGLTNAMGLFVPAGKAEPGEGTRGGSSEEKPV